jgi:hypothetical protein
MGCHQSPDHRIEPVAVQAARTEQLLYPLEVGDAAIDFTLDSVEGPEFSLSDNFGHRPTVLVFGSYT